MIDKVDIVLVKKIKCRFDLGKGCQTIKIDLTNGPLIIKMNVVD